MARRLDPDEVEESERGMYGWSIHTIREQGREESRRWAHQLVLDMASPASLLAGVAGEVYTRIEELAWFRTQAQRVEKDESATARDREIAALWREAVSALERYVVETFADLHTGRDPDYKVTPKRRREGNPGLMAAMKVYLEAVERWRFAVWEEQGPEFSDLVARWKRDREDGTSAARADAAWNKAMGDRKFCPECGKGFEPVRTSQIYDSHACADRAGARRRRSAVNRSFRYNPPNED